VHPPESVLAGGEHFPAESQTDGATQSLTLAHPSLHMPVLSHLYGVQSCVVPFAPVVVWSPSQVAPETHLLVATSQMLPAAHSASVVQVVLHAVAPHA